MFSKPFDLDRTVRTVGAIIILVSLALLVNRLSDVLFPFLFAWLVAYMLNPMVGFVQNKLRFKNRLLSVMTVLTLITGALFGLGAIVANSMRNQMGELKAMSQAYISSPQETQHFPFFRETITNIIEVVDFETLFTKEDITAALQNIVPRAFDLVSTSFSYIAGMFIIFIIILYLIFILIDFDTLVNYSSGLIPRRYRHFGQQVFGDLAEGMSIYFRKQGLISLIVGTLMAIGFTIIGLPMGIVMGYFVGVLTMIPYMHGFGIIPPLLVALIQSTLPGESFLVTAGWISLIFIINQIILDAFLVPRIMGKATGLNPAIILLSLSIWGSLMGVTGMIIALPITTIIISYYKRFVIGSMSISD